MYDLPAIVEEGLFMASLDLDDADDAGTATVKYVVRLF
jgi:hypothetical protein